MKIMNLMLLVFLLFFFGLVSLVLNHSHLLLMVLSLEFLMLSGYLAVIMGVGYYFSDSLVMLLYLFVAVCEGALGLGVLISLVSGFGGDNCMILNLLKC